MRNEIANICQKRGRKTPNCFSLITHFYVFMVSIEILETHLMV